MLGHCNYKRLWNKNLIQNTKDIWLFVIMIFKSCDTSLKLKMAKLKLKINELLLKIKLELRQTLYLQFKFSKKFSKKDEEGRLRLNLEQRNRKFKTDNGNYYVFYVKLSFLYQPFQVLYLYPNSEAFVFAFEWFFSLFDINPAFIFRLFKT